MSFTLDEKDYLYRLITIKTRDLSDTRADINSAIFIDIR